MSASTDSLKSRLSSLLAEIHSSLKRFSEAAESDGGCDFAAAVEIFDRDSISAAGEYLWNLGLTADAKHLIRRFDELLLGTILGTALMRHAQDSSPEYAKWLEETFGRFPSECTPEIEGQQKLLAAGKAVMLKKHVAKLREELTETKATPTNPPIPPTVTAETEMGKAESDRPTRKASINERMAGTIMENSEAMGWNSPQWARYLKCGKSTVVETATWKRLESARLLGKAERRKDRWRKPKASDQRRD